MKKVSELTVDELNDEKEKIEAALIPLRKQVQNLSTQITRKCNRLREVQDRIYEQTLKGDDIEILLEALPESKYKRKLRDEFMRQYHLTAESYFPDTMQQCIRIALYRDNDTITQKTYEGIIRLLPYVKPIKGFKKFDIFESTLSRYGTYWLNYEIEKQFWSVTFSRYSRNEVLYSNEDLMDVLKYIQKRYFYED